MTTKGTIGTDEIGRMDVMGRGGHRQLGPNQIHVCIDCGAELPYLGAPCEREQCINNTLQTTGGSDFDDFEEPSAYDIENAQAPVPTPTPPPRKNRPPVHKTGPVIEVPEQKTHPLVPTGLDGTLQQRGDRYGEYLDHARITNNILRAMGASPNWATLEDHQKEALHMVAHKIARILNGDPNYADNWHDIQGFCKLVEDRLPGGPLQAFSPIPKLVVEG